MSLYDTIPNIGFNRLKGMDKIKELYNIDIKENFIKHLDDALLSILLKDRSSSKNLIWAHGVGINSKKQ